METLQFAHPYWLPVGLLCCVAVAWLQRQLQRRRQKTLARFAGAHLLGKLTRNVSSSRRTLKNILQLLAIMLLFISLAQPQYGFTWTEVKRKGIDILFALDTSKSMLAEDTRPNRLERARLGIMDFVSRLEGDRVGLLPFAGTSYLMCPLTLDYDAFTNSLATVTTDIIPKGGTNISAVISAAENVLSNNANHKILVLLTDGENLEGNVIEQARGAKEKGMTIYTIGAGTTGGELIPLKGGDGFVKDQDGTYVTSRLDEATLTEIAQTTGGIYAPLGNNGQGLEKIYQEKLSLIPKEELLERRQKVPVERFFWPLAASLFLLLVDYLLPEQRLGKRLFQRKTSTKRVGTPLVLLILLTMGLAPRSLLASPAEDAYAAENYLKAGELYQERLEKTPEDPRLHYNFGTTAYKNNLHDEAIAAFTQALKSDDLSLQEKAYFNRGNALYHKGAESRQAAPQKTIEQWQEALASYDATLKLNPEDQRARENRAFVEQQLNELQEQMDQQQESQEDTQERQEQDKENSERQQDNTSQSDQQNKQQQEQRDEQQENSQSDDGQTAQPQQQDQANESSGKSGEEKEQQPQPADSQDQEQQDSTSNTRAGEQDAEDAERRAMGQMTREEAENLLNALKNEEGELNFVPRGQNSTVGRDW